MIGLPRDGSPSPCVKNTGWLQPHSPFHAHDGCYCMRKTFTHGFGLLPPRSGGGRAQRSSDEPAAPAGSLAHVRAGGRPRPRQADGATRESVVYTTRLWTASLRCRGASGGAALCALRVAKLVVVTSATLNSAGNSRPVCLRATQLRTLQPNRGGPLCVKGVRCDGFATR